MLLGFTISSFGCFHWLWDIISPVISSRSTELPIPAIISSSTASHEFDNKPGTYSSIPKTMNTRNYPPYQEAIALYPYERNRVEELSFQAHEVLEVITRPSNEADWWRCRNARGESGWVPRNYLVLMPASKNKEVLCDITDLVSKSCGRNDSRDTCRSPTYNVESELLRMVCAKRSKMASVFLAKPWFWGNLSRAECERMLGLFSVPGEFVVRDSESDVSWAICLTDKISDIFLHAFLCSWNPILFKSPESEWLVLSVVH